MRIYWRNYIQFFELSTRQELLSAPQAYTLSGDYHLYILFIWIILLSFFKRNKYC